MKLLPMRVAGLAALALHAQCGLAQVDLSGNWALQNQQNYTESHYGNLPVDFLGIPLNKDGRAAALGFDAGDVLTELERQCEPWSEHYLVEYGGPPAAGGGISGIRISASTSDRVDGKVEAWQISGSADRMPVTIWMDGRAQPGAADLHTFGGSAAGAWRGDTLVATITNLKDGFLTRNGAPSSNQETLTLFISRHGDLLTITGIIRDPVYLSAPYALAQTYKPFPAGAPAVAEMHCGPSEIIPGFSDGYHSRRNLPGTNSAAAYMSENYNIPADAAQGGEETMYPEYRKKLKGRYTVPGAYCKRYCCGAMGGMNESRAETDRYDHTVLKCVDGGG
jgi:hypothetical protein